MERPRRTTSPPADEALERPRRLRLRRRMMRWNDRGELRLRRRMLRWKIEETTSPPTDDAMVRPRSTTSPPTDVAMERPRRTASPPTDDIGVPWEIPFHSPRPDPLQIRPAVPMCTRRVPAPRFPPDPAGRPDVYQAGPRAQIPSSSGRPSRCVPGGSPRPDSLQFRPAVPTCTSPCDSVSRSSENVVGVISLLHTIASADSVCVAESRNLCSGSDDRVGHSVNEDHAQQSTHNLFPRLQPQDSIVPFVCHRVRLHDRVQPLAERPARVRAEEPGLQNARRQRGRDVAAQREAGGLRPDGRGLGVRHELEGSLADRDVGALPHDIKRRLCEGGEHLAVDRAEREAVPVDILRENGAVALHRDLDVDSARILPHEKRLGAGAGEHSQPHVLGDVNQVLLADGLREVGVPRHRRDGEEESLRVRLVGPHHAVRPPVQHRALVELVIERSLNAVGARYRRLLDEVGRLVLLPVRGDPGGVPADRRLRMARPEDCPVFPRSFGHQPSFHRVRLVADRAILVSDSFLFDMESEEESGRLGSGAWERNRWEIVRVSPKEPEMETRQSQRNG
eukprot:gene309-biopygen3451